MMEISIIPLPIHRADVPSTILKGGTFVGSESYIKLRFSKLGYSVTIGSYVCVLLVQLISGSAKS